jgi:DNA repair exonuclease SbcCD ATPase subunit
MRLISYKLQNWGPHKSQSLLFPENSKTIAICGENDRGKSWVVRGIGFTLSIGRNEYGDQSSIHCGEQQAYHELIFEHGGQQYIIEKYVNGKGSEEEGTITKINGASVNRAEYEEFYKSKLGLPHPSIWLPICISMQNQTDFHLRSKKRDREEALRAICQLNKLDNWKDSLNQLQKDEDRLLLSVNSKTKGALEQIEAELSNLERKLSDQSKKIKDLKAYSCDSKAPTQISWDDIVTTSKKFEAAIQNLQRKKLEKTNIERQLNLLNNSLARCQKDLENYTKNFDEASLVEKEREFYKVCLQKLRMKLLTQDVKSNIKRKAELDSAIEEYATSYSNKGETLNNFKISEAEETLSEITEQTYRLKNYLSEFAPLKEGWTLKETNSIESFDAQIKKKKTIKALLTKGLVEIEALKAQEELHRKEIKDLCDSLKISEELALKAPDQVQTELLDKELDNLSQLTKAILWGKFNAKGPQSNQPTINCPVCDSTIDHNILKRGKDKEDLCNVENSKLRLAFRLEEKLESSREIKTKISTWENDYGNQSKLQKDIITIDEELSKLHQSRVLLTTISKELENAKAPYDSSQKDCAPIDCAHKLITALNEKGKLTKEMLKAFNNKSKLESERGQLLRENERILRQIEFYSEEINESSLPKDLDEKIEQTLLTSSETELKEKVQSIERNLSKVKEIQSSMDIKRKEILSLEADKRSCLTQLNSIEELIHKEQDHLESGTLLPVPREFAIPRTDNQIEKWEQISNEWQRRDTEVQRAEAVIQSIKPRFLELQRERKDLQQKLKESEAATKQIACAKRLISFLDYKNAPRKLLEGVVNNLFELTNRLGESLDVDIKLKLGKNLEFLTVQSRSGKWIEQKTERLGYGKGAILGICFRLACQKLLLPETGFLILDEPTANVDIKRKGLFKMFLQNLSEEYTESPQSKTGQIMLIEHDEDVVELCQTKIDIKE